jgi:hypothetical protein
MVSYSQTLIPKIGGTLSNVAFDKDVKNPNTDYKNKAGLMFGLAVEIPLKGKISLQPELLFQQKGVKTESTGDYSFKSTVTLNYLELPVLVKLNFNKFYVNVGPSISYGIGGRYQDKYVFSGQTTKTSGSVIFGKEPANYNSDNAYVDKVLDFGLQIGGGFKVARYLIIDVRYGLGFTNITNKETANGIIKDRANNHSLQLSLGFPISL